MWKGAFVLNLLLTVGKIVWALEDANADTFTPQNCSLDCLRQGDPQCKYCRITPRDVQKALGSAAPKILGSCIPWPCFELVGNKDPDICHHYVDSPKNVTVETLEDPDPSSDSVVISWRPSPFGIDFLRGFQVSLQALGGIRIYCQLFLFHSNLSLPASHSKKVYKSDPFRGLPLGSQYAVTVMALPVPELGGRSYETTKFYTRSCAEKNELDKCKRDWYPQHVSIEQNGTTAAVTFNLAPESLDIRTYFSICYIDGLKKKTNEVHITPNLSTNKTHHTFKLQDLQEGTNYTCEIAADEVDAVRKTFIIQVKEPESTLSTSPLALLLPLALALAAIIIIIVVAFTLSKAKMKLLKLPIVPDSDIMKEHQESKTQEEVISWPKTRVSAPRLLICYSSFEGPAHIKAVMKLGSFIQQHMATQVCLDLWDSLSVAQEGSLAWHSRHIRDCDFVLVVCSPGLSHRLGTSQLKENPEEEEESTWETDNSCAEAAISLIGAEVGRAKARGQDLSKYMAAIFEYSEETDIPTELSLVSHYTLTTDLPLLFSHLHGVSLHRPGGYLKISHISEEGFTKLPAGAALQSTICEAAEVMKARRIVQQ